MANISPLLPILNSSSKDIDAGQFGVQRLGSLNAVTAVIMQLQMLLSYAGEAFVVYVVLSKKENRISVNFMLLSHVAAEASDMFAWSVLNCYYMVVWPDEAACHVASILGHVSQAVVMFTNALLSYNRYYAMFHEHDYPDRFSRRNTLLMICGVWLLALLISIGTISDTRPAYGPINFCYPDVSGWSSWQDFYFLVGSIIIMAPFSYNCVIYCNLKVYQKLKKHMADTANLHNTQKAAKMQQFREVQKMIIIFFTLPPLFQFPTQIGWFVKGYANFPWLGRAAVLLAHILPCVNPYVTIFCLKSFREEAVRVWRKLLRKNKIQPHRQSNVFSVSKSCGQALA